MTAAANPLRGLHLLDTEGKQVPVDSLWQEGAAVIGFVRHFG